MPQKGHIVVVYKNIISPRAAAAAQKRKTNKTPPPNGGGKHFQTGVYGRALLAIRRSKMNAILLVKP